MSAANELWVNSNEKAVLFRNGKYFRQLGPGRHSLARYRQFFWFSWNPIIEVRIVKTEARRLIGDPISVRSSDGETIKFKPIIDFKVTDPRKTAELREKEEDRLKSDTMLALERVAGLKTNSDLLNVAKRLSLEGAFKTHLQRYADDYGIEIDKAKLTTATSDKKSKDKDDKNTPTLKVEADITNK